MGTSFRRQLLFTSLLIGFVFIIVAPLRASAASPSQTLTISPDSINEVIQPNSVNVSNIIVKNEGTSGYDYNVYAAPYSVIGESYRPSFSATSSAPNITSWFHFAGNSGYLNSGSSVSISYTITVPQNTPPGGYYAAVFAQTKPPAIGQKKPIVQINQRLGQLLYLQVAGPVVEKGSIASWQANFLQEPPATGTLRLENAGAVHYVSDINVSFNDILGNLKYSYVGHYVVLPHTVRRILVTWPHSPAIGLFKINGSVATYGSHQLGTKYILVISKTARIVTTVVIGLVIIASIIRLILRRLTKSKKTVKPKKDEDKELKNDT